MTASRPSCHRPELQKQKQKQKQNSLKARLDVSRRLKVWRPRLPSKPTRDVAERHPGRPRWRISRISSAPRGIVLALRTLRYSTMTTPTAAQADHF